MIQQLLTGEGGVLLITQEQVIGDIGVAGVKDGRDAQIATAVARCISA